MPQPCSPRSGTGVPPNSAPLVLLTDLASGETAVIESLDLPADIAKRLMELGFVPGNTISPGRSAPGGEPRVYQIDGSEIAIRRETAKHLTVRRMPHP